MNDLGILERAWAVLTAPTVSNFSTFPLDLQINEASVRVALDRRGFRHLLVPSDDEGVTPDDRPSVLQLAVRDLYFEDGAHSYVDLFCTDRELYPEFDDVVQDVLEAVTDAVRPGAEALRAVARWRRLFRSHLVRGLALPTKIGLFAELSILSALLDRDPRFSVGTWTGPLRKPHDFEAPARCIEVKGVGSDSDSFEVHGLDQLDTHDDRGLELAIVAVQADPDGTSLEDLVAEVRSRVSDRLEFRRRLVASGWSEDFPSPAVDYFSISSVIRVEVGANTPRLVPSDIAQGRLAKGVSALTYRVDLQEVTANASGSSLSELAELAIP